MEKTLWNIFRTFFLTGIELVGGGFVIVPVLSRTIVNKYKWVSETDLVDYYTLAQSLPGIIAANVSVLVGYKLKGKLGGLVALLGLIIAPIISICVVALIFAAISDLKFVQSLFYGIGIAVVVLICISLEEMWDKSIYDIFTTLIFVVTFALSFFLHLSPVLIVLGALFIGIILAFFKTRER